MMQPGFDCLLMMPPLGMDASKLLLLIDIDDASFHTHNMHSLSS